MNRLKLFLKTEGDKLKEMSFRDKRLYIWEYYKIHIFAAIFILIILGSLIDAWFINKPKKPYLHVAWMASYQTPEDLMLLSQILTDALVEDKTQEEVLISSFLLSGADPTYDMAIQQRFIAMLAAGELHAFIIEDEDYVWGMAEAETIRPMDKVMAELEMLDKALHDRIVPLLVYAEYDDSRTGELTGGLFGVPLAGSSLLEGLGINTDDLFLCKVVIDGHDLPTARAIQVLYE
jgi:hypothetical protein